MWSSSQALARSELLYVSTSFSICQELFSSFSNFFSIRYLSCRSRDSFDIISLHTRFVNTFFKGNYFYFEILFLMAALGRFPPVPAVSWPLYPGCDPFIHALRRGALYLWRCRIRSQDAGYDGWAFISGLRDFIMVSLLLLFVVLRVSAGLNLRSLIFMLLHVFLCIVDLDWSDTESGVYRTFKFHLVYG